ncbi:MAG: glutaredoxin family protein [Candidatus Thorarchaeota archaeon]|jgi:protein-disulfide isomerase
MQRSSFRHHKALVEAGDTVNDFNSIKIKVFTSEQCAFCNIALQIVEEAVGRLDYYHPFIEVVETPVEDRPRLTEKLQILAVPTIVVSDSRIVGLPAADELEQLIHQEMFHSKLK